MPTDTPPPFATAGGEDPSSFARELVGEAAAGYTRARKATIAGVAPARGDVSCAHAADLLRAAVVAYAKALRVAGVPPERAVVEVTSAIDAELKLDALDRRACVGTAVRWAIKAYDDA